MILTTYQKTLYGLALIGIVIMITIPDVIIELLIEFIHIVFELLFEVADIAFEWVETLFDHLVEHLFHTELHDTQIIVFYTLMSIIAYPLYYLGRILLRLVFRLKETLPVSWALYKARVMLFWQDVVFYWQDLSLIDKIKWAVMATGAVYLASFLFM
jgi:hypothetical protein